MRIRLRCALEELLGRTLKAQPLIAFQHPILIIVLFEEEDHNLIHRLLWHGLCALP